ncbi:MAG: GntR family transcriptional regulator [Spirochaetales bacterium]|nr:GntR family transcriptional regulator [Spirochaetales bacterium]
MLDDSSPLPLYFQLQEIIRKRIMDQEFKPGDIIPSEKELEKIYNVSRITVRNAISGLVFEDLLVKKQGKGTIVAFPKMQENGNTTLQSFTEKMKKQGKITSTEVLNVLRIPATDRLLEHLDINLDEQIIYAKRLRKVDSEPIALFENYICAHTGMTEKDDFSGSVFELLENKYRVKIISSEKVIEAGLASKEDAIFLKISAGDPVLIIRYTTFDDNNDRIEYAEGVYRADKYKYMVRLKR